MRVSIVPVIVVGSLLALGGCSTLGQPAEFTLAELNQRCASRGGQLTPTNQQTGEPRRDYRCTGVNVRAVSTEQARTQQNGAIDRALLGRRL